LIVMVFYRDKIPQKLDAEKWKQFVANCTDTLHAKNDMYVILSGKGRSGTGVLAWCLLQEGTGTRHLGLKTKFPKVLLLTDGKPLDLRP
jgi:hypothetical protein